MSLVAEAVCKGGSFGHPGVLKFCIFQPSPASKFIQGYLGAVISAVSIAVSSPHPAPSTPPCCSAAVPPASRARPCLRVRAGQAAREAEVSVWGLSGKEKKTIGREGDAFVEGEHRPVLQVRENRRGGEGRQRPWAMRRADRPAGAGSLL